MNAGTHRLDLLAETWPFGRVRTRRSGFFVPDSAGQPMTLVPVESAAGEVIDIVAYDLATPNRWWMRTGLGVALGERAIEMARDYRLEIRLCATPHEWLRCRAPLSCCVLQPQRARAILAGVQTIREGRRHAA